jgi:hypothetical protein
MGRLGNVDELNNLAVFLASHASTYDWQRPSLRRWLHLRVTSDLLGKGIKVSGKLVGKIWRATNKRWSSYSERQYEEERVGRW